MTTLTCRAFRWAPRILCAAFTVFISMFALDVFGHGRGPWETFVALMMHLIPSFTLLVILALAWKWEWIGAVGSTALAVVFLWWNYTVRHNVPSAVLVIAGPLFLMAGLYLFAWVKRREIRRQA